MPILTPAAAANTKGSMVLIKSIIADGTFGTFGFYNIPQTYQDLMLIYYVRSDYAQYTTTFSTYTNNAIYSLSSFTNFNGVGSLTFGSTASNTIAYNQATNGSYAVGCEIPAGLSSLGLHASGMIYYPNYTSSNNKVYIVRNSIVSHPVPYATTQQTIGLYRDTAPITQLIPSTNGNYKVGSYMELWGIRAVNQ
jgi:hypothetical protein